MARTRRRPSSALFRSRKEFYGTAGVRFRKQTDALRTSGSQRRRQIPHRHTSAFDLWQTAATGNPKNAIGTDVELRGRERASASRTPERVEIAIGALTARLNRWRSGRTPPQTFLKAGSSEAGPADLAMRSNRGKSIYRLARIAAIQPGDSCAA